MSKTFFAKHQATCFILMIFVGHTAVAQATQDTLMNIVSTELDRELPQLNKAHDAPYFVSYNIADIQSARVSSSFGSIVSSGNYHSRLMLTNVKLGSYESDNSQQSEGYEDMFDRGMGGRAARLPVDNDADAVRYIVWQQTQDHYRAALRRFKSRKKRADSIAAKFNDFSKEASAVYLDGPVTRMKNFFHPEDWTDRIKKFSAVFTGNKDIVSASASIEASVERKYLISSEGSRIAQNRTYCYLMIQSSIRAEDGDIVPLYLSYFAFIPSRLPADEIILKDIENMIAKLNILRTAPVAEPYSGPAILSSHAAGVFFHEIFGHRVEGHRLKDKNDGQTFKGRIGEQVLPKTFNVTSDPAMSDFQGQELNGHYAYDDEGIKGQRVNIVEKGILKTFLMSRSPIENLPHSNGHGRAEPGAAPVSRQSNLIIESEKPVQMSGLRKMLISECKKQKKDYGYLFKDVMGGFTTTGRYMPNAFNIFPTEVYRVYVDGRPDQLVRGVDLIGTPLAMFAEIKAADDKASVFTGFCGAESGSVPVTAIAPSLFVSRIETQKKASSNVETMLLSRPSETNTP